MMFARRLSIVASSFFVAPFSPAQAETAGESAEWTLPEKPASPPTIDFWYGDEQIFGNRGDTQPLINLLGSIRPTSHVGDTWYQFNNGKWKQLVLGPDLHRLARPGDFNVEFERTKLKEGENTFRIRLHDLWGRKTTGKMSFLYQPGKTWPIPYEVDFSKVKRLQEKVEIIDGKWHLTEKGVRTSEPYYDRQLAFGDAKWSNVELEAEIIFHRHFTGFRNRNWNGPPYLSHAHTSFNLRWGGHPDDGAHPRRAWQNLGSLVALRTDLARKKAGSYWWMHYGFGQKGKPAPRSQMLQEQRHQIAFEEPYLYRMRAETLNAGTTRYSTKVWKKGETEPADWQMVGTDLSETLAAGSIVFVVHHSDVTLCRVRVTKLP
jgi:hypothetical protein